MNSPHHKRSQTSGRATSDRSSTTSSSRVRRTTSHGAAHSHHARQRSRLTTTNRAATEASEGVLARYAPVVVGALIVIAICLFVALFSAIGQCSTDEPPASDAPYVSPYDFSGLTLEGDRFSYAEDGVVKSQVGVDVSDHQGAIDWQAVAHDGIDFAIVRAASRGYTEGGLMPDTYFAEHIDGAQAAGLDVGAYFFSQAISVEEAVEEAELMLAQLDGRKLSLPVVYDHESVTSAEGRANSVDRETLTACAIAFCERIEAAGYTTMIYGNAGDLSRFDRTALGNRPVWFAEYDVAAPTAQFDFVMWQYTNTGQVAGISTAVDLNLRFTDML